MSPVEEAMTEFAPSLLPGSFGMRAHEIDLLSLSDVDPQTLLMTLYKTTYWLLTPGHSDKGRHRSCCFPARNKVMPLYQGLRST